MQPSQESNLRPSHYQRDALPSGLFHHNEFKIYRFWAKCFTGSIIAQNKFIFDIAESAYFDSKSPLSITNISKMETFIVLKKYSIPCSKSMKCSKTLNSNVCSQSEEEIHIIERLIERSVELGRQNRSELCLEGDQIQLNN